MRDLRIIELAKEWAKDDILFLDAGKPKKGRKMGQDPRQDALLRRMYPSSVKRRIPKGRTREDRMYPTMRGMSGASNVAKTPRDARLRKMYPSLRGK